jgi:pilus assembly protein CpaB
VTAIERGRPFAGWGNWIVRTSTIVMIGFAALFGVLAVFLAQSWLSGQAEMRLRNLEAQRKPVATQTIVVASKALRFGTELSSSALRELPWPEDAVPAGAFSRIADLLNGNGRRVVLTPIEANELILAPKITGPGQRATLSAALQDGMKAVTIRVNDVDGVAGFVLPGDRVDVALTRQKDSNGKDRSTTDVVLQNVRVLAVDQTADERNDKPAVVKAVTLEVDLSSAQKLALAASVGNLSLMLRKAGEAAAESTRAISLSDLGGGDAVAQQDKIFAAIRVYRPTKDAQKYSREDYSVPAEAPTVGQRSALQ